MGNLPKDITDLTFVDVEGDSFAVIDDKNIEMPAIFHQALLISYAGLKSLGICGPPGSCKVLEEDELGPRCVCYRRFMFSK